jgi:hypothetical protein
MRGVNEAAARYRQSRGIERSRHPDPFPLATLAPTAARRVRSRRTGRDDHWLTTWSAQLPSTPGPEGGRSSVVGATIELRVGAGGQVLSVVSRVRPWRESFARPCFDMSQTNGDHGHHDDGDHEHHDAGDHQGSDEEPAIVYVSDNPHEAMRFLAPCWAIPPADEESHHARRLWPACDHTVLPEILVTDQRGEASVSAQVLTGKYEVVDAPHGDEWRVRWSVATLAGFIAGERRVNDGSSAPLPGPGVYHVGLELEHLETGALRSTYSQIAVAPARAESRRRGVPQR